MKTIAHLTDLHFGRTADGVVERLYHDLAEQAPEFVVISGDLTQRAARKEFRAFGRFVRRLDAQTLVVPGNHDVPAAKFWLRFAVPFDRYRRFVTDELDPVMIEPDIAMVGLNSARRMALHWNWSHGRISFAQMRHLLDAFADVPDDALKVVTLHHPMAAPPEKPGQKLVGRVNHLVRALDKAGVDLVLTGHLHRNLVVNLQEEYESLSRPLWSLQTTTTTSDRLRGHPNAYSLIKVDSDTVRVEHRAFDEQEVESSEVHRWQRRDDGLHPTTQDQN